MSMGRQSKPQQTPMWVSGPNLARSPGHRFYEKPNELLREEKFDPASKSFAPRTSKRTTSQAARRSPRGCTSGCSSSVTSRGSSRSAGWSGSARIRYRCARSLACR